jgi:hypothetical protein
MKDRLESFIEENIEQFDLYKPSDQVWKELNERNHKSGFSLKKLKTVVTRSAAALLIFVASYAFHEYMDYREMARNESPDKAIFKSAPELKEAEYYYNNMVSDKMKELQPYFSKLPGLESDIKVDLHELDVILYALKEDLKDNAANDQVIEAMIQNYRIKLQILENLLNELKKENKNTKDEKTSYPI